MTGDPGEGRTSDAPDLPPRRSVPARYRFLVFVLATAAGILGFRAALSPFGGTIDTMLGARIPAFYLMMTGGLLVGHWWTLRTMEPRGWAVVRLGRAQFGWRQVFAGLALGGLAVGGPSAILLLAGWLRIEPSPPGDWWHAALATLAVLVPAALWEELLTRGYAFSLIRDALGARRAIVVTSVVFGLLHIENAGATWQSIALVMLAGIFLGSILVALDSLYAAWAAHVAWNFVMAGVLHATVSGVGMGSPNYRTVDAGPDWATGGAWGPEAGLLTGGGLLLGIYIMLRRRRRGVDS